MSTISERLAIIIDGHSDGAVSAVKRLSLEETAAAERAEVLQVKLAELNTRIAKSATGGTGAQRLQLSKLNAEYSTLTAGLAKVPAGAARAEAALGKVGLGNLVPSSTLSALGKAAPGLLAGAAVFGGFEFLKHGIESYEALATQIRSVAQASGATAPEASKLVEITNALGLSSDSTALGLFRLGKNIELTPQKLIAYNIAVARTKTGNVDLIGTLFNVADAYQHTTDPAKRAALVFQAFGRAGTTMLPILNANRKQLEEIAAQASKHGLIFSSKDLQNARDMQVATHEMKDAFNTLSIDAARTLVPLLTTLASVSTKVTDLVNGPAGKVVGTGLKTLGEGLIEGPLAFLPGKYNPLNHVFPGGGSKGAKAQALAEIHNEQLQAQTDALANAALATLAPSFDALASTQNVATAKNNLLAARAALVTARAERLKAERELATAKSGTSGATASSVAAAEARVSAAEAKLRAARYVGGDARTSAAQASLLSSQDHLNKLRAHGGVNTGKLADATERLRLADLKVTAAQAKAREAQKASNQATGLSGQDALARLTAQAHDQQKLADANVRLAAAGLNTDVIAGLDKLNQQSPGTLVKVAADVARKGLAAELNAQQDALNSAQEQFKQSAAQPDLFAKAGATNGAAFGGAFAAAAAPYMQLWRAPIFSPTTPAYAPSPAYRRGGVRANAGDRPVGSTGVVITIGELRVDSRNGQQLAADLAKHARSMS